MVTAGDLIEQAGRLRALLDIRRGQADYAGLEKQIDALRERVDHLMWECESLRGDVPAFVLEFPGPLPRIRPFIEMPDQP